MPDSYAAARMHRVAQLSETRVRWFLAGLALVGLGIAGYLTAVHYEGGEPVCLVGGGCAVVQESDYAEMAGIPVPLIGVIGYLTVLLAAALPGDPGRLLGLFAGVIGFGFSMYLTYLELFVIDAICQWCIGSAVVMTLVFIVALLRAVRFTGTSTHASAPLPAAD